MLKAPALKKGDKVATISLSWGGPGSFPHRYEAGKKQLSDAFKLQIVETPNALKSAEWIYKNPKARADDLMQAFSDPSIKAIISTIGGDESVRLLPFLDLEVIRKNPKIFLGYSNTTIHSQSTMEGIGVVSFFAKTSISTVPRAVLVGCFRWLS